MADKQSSRTQIVLTVLLLILLVFGLLRINQNLFHYRDAYTLNRIFSAGTETKGRTLLTHSKTLKRGVYTLKFTGHADGKGNGYFVESHGQELLSEEFDPGEVVESVLLVIDETSAQIQIGVSYEPAGGDFRMDSIVITSNSVLTRGSLLRHLTLSVCWILLVGFLFLRVLRPDTLKRRLGRAATKENERMVLLWLGLTVLTSLPLFSPDSYVQADDFMFHLSRIEGITEGLEAGYFPVRIHLFTLNGTGYGSGLYYPDIFLYIPAILRLLGFSVLSAYKIFAIGLNFLMIASISLAAKRISANRCATVAAAVLYAFASYRWSDFYYRAALGEMQALVFIPWIVVGFYEISELRPKGWHALAFGFAGVALSHLISLMIVGLAAIVWALIKLPLLLRERCARTALIKAVIIVLGVSAFFYLPMIEQSLSDNTYADQMLAAPSQSVEQNFILSIADLLKFQSTWQQVDTNLGYPLALAPLLLLFIRKRRNPVIQVSIRLIVAGSLIALMSTDLFPWSSFAWLLSRIQFSLRLLVLATPLLTLGAGLALGEIVMIRFWKPAVTALFIACIAFSLPMMLNILQNRAVSVPDFRLDPVHVKGGEYLPLGTDPEFVEKNRDTVLSENSAFETKGFKRSGLSFTFSYRVTAPSPNDEPLRFEVPLLYYKGYQAWIETPDGGSKTWLSVQRGSHGFTEVSITDYPEQGEITVEYFTTKAQYAGSGITALTLLALFISWIRVRKKHADGWMLR